MSHALPGRYVDRLTLRVSERDGPKDRRMLARLAHAGGGGDRRRRIAPRLAAVAGDQERGVPGVRATDRKDPKLHTPGKDYASATASLTIPTMSAPRCLSAGATA